MGTFTRKKYSGTYCVGCESFKLEKDLVDRKCPDHPTTELKNIEEENYFFRLSKYKSELQEWFSNNPQFLEPTSKSEELKNIIENVEDISISRLKSVVSWGVPVPGDDEQTGQSDELRQHIINVFERQIRIVELGKCDRAVYNHQPELSIYIDVKGFFVNCDNYHDLFRKSDYPNDILWSFEETLEYIKKYNCTTYEWSELRLKEFWSEHPDGLIKFG